MELYDVAAAGPSTASPAAKTCVVTLILRALVKSNLLFQTLLGQRRGPSNEAVQFVLAQTSSPPRYWN